MRKMRSELQIIFQDPFSSLDPRKTVSQTIAEPMLVHKTVPKDQIRSRVHELMETVGLADRLINSYPHELDGGRRQRIGVARALAVNPKFIVCDEPVSALDVSIQAQILNLLKDLQKRFGLTYIFITHDLSSSIIFLMTSLSCIWDNWSRKASAEELFARPSHPYTEALLSAIPIPRSAVRGVNAFCSRAKSPLRSISQ